MRSRILITLTILISIGLLLLTHQLTGERRSIVRIQTDVTDQDHQAIGKNIRFDLLRTSLTGLLDSLSQIDVLSTPRQVFRIVEDEQREAFLRSAIEQKGFLLSRIATRGLNSIERARSAYIEHILPQPALSDMIEAVGQLHGPLFALPVLVNAPAIWPEHLHREHRLYNPVREILVDEATGAAPDARTYELFDAWGRALKAYIVLYHRDLLERSIFTTGLYREWSIASAETDSLGEATMPPVPYGTYWLAGHDPTDVMQLARIHHLRMLQRLHPALTNLPRLLSWDRPILVNQADQLVTVSPAEDVIRP